MFIGLIWDVELSDDVISFSLYSTEELHESNLKKPDDDVTPLTHDPACSQNPFKETLKKWKKEFIHRQELDSYYSL